ncbi:MAG: WYL domain-containing protein, partial [Planctomycetota bacterium]
AAAEQTDPERRIRSWKLDRFEKADVLDKYFKVPADLDLEKYIGHSLGMFVSNHPRDFKIRIGAHAARWVQEDPWHPDQIVKPLKDGAIELTVKAAHDLDIIPRVLNLGADAEILSPNSARQHMAEIVRRMAENYSV